VDDMTLAATDRETGPCGPTAPAALWPRRDHETAERAMRAWHRMEETLAPIIGIGGVGAIYGRSLALSRRTFPWLPVSSGSSCGRIEPSSLGDALARQPAIEASAADAMLQRTFRELLTSLVGPRLSSRLLALPCQMSGRNDGWQEKAQ
jgi:hypothetical protein